MLKIIVCSILISLSLFGAKVEKKAVSTSLVKEKMQPIQKTTIEGQGFLKTRGGDVKTCSGESVFLYKLDDYLKLGEEKIKISTLERYRRHGESYEKTGSISDHFYSKIVNDIENLQKLYPQLNIRSTYQKDTFNEDIDKAKIFVTASGPVLETMCDASGNFIIKNVPFGMYGIVTKVTWDRVETGNRYISPYTITEGGKIGKAINVNDNLQKVFITNIFPIREEEDH